MRPALALIALAGVAHADPPMAGPYGAPAEFVAELQRGGAYVGERSTIGPTTAHAAGLTLTGGGRKSSWLAIRTARGWLVDRTLGDVYDPDAAGLPHVLHDNLRSSYELVDLVELGDRVVLRAIDLPFHRDARGEGWDREPIAVVCRLAAGACAAPVELGGAAWLYAAAWLSPR